MSRVASAANTNASGLLEDRLAAEPDITDLNDGFRFSWWKTYGVFVEITHIQESRRELRAEIVVQSKAMPATKPVHWSDINLTSASSRKTLANELNERHPDVPWRELLEEVCRGAAWRYRAGTPTEELTPSDEPVQYAVDKVLLLNAINGWHAHGGNLKSYGALAVGMAVSLGMSLPCGLTPRIRGPVIYYDPETDRETVRRRIGALMRGFRLDSSQPTGVRYYKPHRTIMDEADALRAEILRSKAVLTIVDSFHASIGGMSILDAAIPFMNALRNLPGTKLFINHVAKASADQNRSTMGLGTVTMMNGPRNCWELKASEDTDGDGRTVGFYHIKHNNTRKLAPFALRYEFAESDAGLLTLRIGAGELSGSPDLLARSPLQTQILEHLKGGGLSVDHLSERTGAPDNQVRARLHDLVKAGKVIRLDEVRGGRWGLKA